MRNICNLRHILCFPICDGNEVIGVAELCNKQSGAHFTKFDEEMAMAFRYLLPHSALWEKPIQKWMGLRI